MVSGETVLVLKKLIIIILFLAVAALGAGFWAYQQAINFTQQPVMLENAQLVEVKPGTSYRKLIRQFEENKWISDEIGRAHV